MKLSRSRCVFRPISFLIAAGFLYLAKVAYGANEFRRCYNTSVEMHCFDLQYDNNKSPLIASNDNARQRCRNLNSTLLIIKDEETNNIVQNYRSDPYNPIRYQYFWTDAYRVNDYSNSYVWHWVNSRLPTLAASDVSWIFDYTTYVAALEFRSDSGKPQFYLTAKQPQYSYSYVCEYAVSGCPSTGSNVFQFSDRCHVSFSESVSWYEARNRCLKDGGDLATFSNVSNINFTSWLGSNPYVRFWIGLRFSWYIWKDSGDDARFTKLALNQVASTSQCLVVCFNCNPSFSWSSKDCNVTDSIYVVCHSVTPLVTSTIYTVKVTTSPAMQTSTSSRNEFVPTADIQQAKPTSDGSLGIGLGVGLGVPLVIFIILTAYFAAKSRRLETRQELQTSNNRIELGGVNETPVVQVSDSANDQYQQLNRNQDTSTGTMYDKLRVAAQEQTYEEFQPNGT